MRIQVVDFNPLAHKFAHGAAPLSHRIQKPDGSITTINTSIQNGVLKSINRWSMDGRLPMAVCFDAPAPTRKAFFAETVFEGTGEAYKGGRASIGGPMFEAMTMTRDMLHNSGVSCYQAHNYEADDLIKAVIDASQKQYGNDVPIDVITNDQDMLPLVDDQISVWIRSMKNTYSEIPGLEKMKYVQVTPRNYQEVVEGLSEYKSSNMLVPYNTILLYKMLRGDSSDNIPGFKRKFPPRKMRAMLEEWQEAGLEIDRIFRYGGASEYFPIIKELVGHYCDGDEELLTSIMKNYWGMNLNADYRAVGSAPARPAAVVAPPTTFDPTVLAETAIQLGINIPLGRV